MKISEVSKYIDALQFACDVLFADSINNAVDMTYGLSDAFDRLGTLNIGLLLEESMQPEAVMMWNKLIDINHRKNEQPNNIPFTKLTPERLKERMLDIYERFPLIECIDNKHLGYSSIWDDIELGKLLLQSNIENLSNIPFTKCNDVVDILIDRLIEFQNLYSDIERPLSTDADEKDLPDILKHPEIRKDFDKAIQIGLLLDYYTLNPDKEKASKMLLACFCWGICKQYDKGTIAKSGKDKRGFAANWTHFAFIKDAKGKDINLNQGWQNAKNKNLDRNEKTGRVQFYPEKLKEFSFWEHLSNEFKDNE